MKTLRDLAEHIRGWHDDHLDIAPTDETLSMWATEMDQCLELIEAKADEIHILIRGVRLSSANLDDQLSTMDELVHSIIEETQCGYVTTKHQEDDDETDAAGRD